MKVVSFTFHHVSIKTRLTYPVEVRGIDSHSTMYLLKRYEGLPVWDEDLHSHSTMYLLKHRAHGSGSQSSPIHIPPCIY